MKNKHLLENFRYSFKKKLVTLLLVCTGLFGVSVSASASWNLSAGTYYYDNSQTQWGTVYFFIGHASYIRSYAMTQVSGDSNTWSVTMAAWSGATGCYFGNGSGGSAIVAGSSSYNISTAAGSLPTAITGRTATYTTAAPTISYRFVPSATTPVTAVPGSWASYPVKPSLTGSAATSISTTVATLNGNISSTGGASITDYGFYYSTTNGFADGAGTKAQVGTSSYTGAISKALSSLTAGTTYYFKAYATNSVGTTYTSQLSFATSAANTAPLLTTTAATSIGNGTGTMNGNISSNGGASITDYGFYWSTTNAFADGTGTKVQVGTSDYTGNVSSALSSLTNGTTYYYKAYASNSVGTTYGTQQSFVPCANATVVSSTASSVGSATGTMNGNVTADGGGTVTDKGFYYSTTSGNTSGTGGTAVSVGTGTGTFSSTLTSLTNGTTYYYRAYATNASGTVYSATEQSFTPSVVKGVLSGSQISFYIGEQASWGQTSISANTGVMTGTVATATMSSTATINTVSCKYASVCIPSAQYYVTHAPTTWTGIQMASAAEAGKYYIVNNSSSLGGTSDNIYVVAGAQFGNTYFDSSTSTTTKSVVQGTTSITLSSQTSSAGYTSAVGSSMHFEYYLVNGSDYTLIGTSSTIGAAATQVSTTYNPSSLTTGTYSIYTVLTDGTIYIKSGTTLTLTITGTTAPVLTTTAATSVGNAIGTMNGNISSNGGASITDYGFYWSTTNGFADGAGTKVQVGTSDYTGAVSSALSSLTNGTTYYYKAYATNSVGTTYGTQQSFTPSTTPTVTSSAATSVGSGIGTMNGEVTADGGSTVTGRGFYYSTTSGNTNGTGGTAVAVGSGTGTFSSALTSLTNGTTYYYKAYATNANGTVYSTTEQSFTPSAIATVTSSAATSVSSGTGTMNGNVTADGGNTVTARGFYYSTTSGNTSGTGGTAVAVGSGTGAFSSTLTSLTNGTTYYYKAYATNANGTVYSSTEQSFTPCSAPVSYAQSVTITACGSKTIDLTAGLTGSIPGDAGTVTYTVSPVGDGLTISGSTATFSATANKTYTITISFSNAAYCSVSGTLSVTYTNNTPSISLTNTKTGKSASATYPYEAFVLTATTDNTPVTWTLTQPSGVTDGTLTISADTKTATFVGGTSNASPHTIEAATVAVGSCSAASVEYDVYVDAAPTETCAESTITVRLSASTVTSVWGSVTPKVYAWGTNFTTGDYSWSSFQDMTLNGTWWEHTIHGSSATTVASVIFGTTQSPGDANCTDDIASITASTCYDVSSSVSGGSSSTRHDVSVQTSGCTSGGSTPTNPTVLRGATASVNSGTSEATLYGYLKFTGCSTITAYGFQYANNASFTGATSVTTTGSLTAASTYNKTFDVSGLTVGTYYYRAYATNGIGTDYSDSATFVIANVKPALTTTAATSIGKTSGTMNGNISSNGGSSITDYGFYWSTTNSFADGTGTKVQVGTSDYTGNISSQLTGLTTGTTYYYKAYATSASGTSYGTQQSFTPAVAVAIKPCTGQTWALNSATTPVALDFGSSTIGTSDYETISVLVVGASGKTLNVNSTSGFKMYNSSDDSYDRPVGFAIASDSVCVSVPLRWLPDTDELGTTQDGMIIKGTVSFMVDAITASADTLAVQGTVTPNVLVYPSSAMVMVGQNQTINIAKSCTTTPTATITTGNAAEWTVNYTPASGNKNGTFSIAFDNSVSAVTGSNLASAVLTITDCDSTRTVALSGRAAVTAPTITALVTSVCDDDFTSFGEIHVSNYGGFTSGFTGAYTYQWQKYVNSAWTTYADGSGATTNNIRPKYSGDYRCVLTRNGLSVTSNTVTISSSSCSATTVCSTLPVVIVKTNATNGAFPSKCSQASSYWSECVANPNNITPSPDVKTKISVDVKILWDGTASDVDGTVTQSDITSSSKLYYDKKAQMNYRGSSSLNFDKKSYAFAVAGDSCTTAGKFVKGKENMFGISDGKNKDWILYAAFPDASMMRDKLAIDTYEAMTGLWTSHSRYVELYVDGTYQGVYVFMEKVEQSAERININAAKGYAFKLDKTEVFDRAEDRHASDPNTADGTTFITTRTGKHNLTTYSSVVDQAFEVDYLPNGNEIGGTGSATATTDLAALKAHFIAFEDSLAAGDFTKVRQYIDYDSWADWFILNEFTKNVDSYRLSTWFTMDSINAPIKATPIWDYELGFNNTATGVDAGHTSTAGWMYSNANLKSDLFPIPFWFEGGSSFTGTPKGLMDDPCFKAKIKERWAVHTANGGALSDAVITAKINAMDASLSNTASCSGSSPIAREVAKYPVANRGVAGYNSQSSYATQKSTIETWCTGRRTAMDALIAAFDTDLGASIASSPTGTSQVEDASVSLTTSVTSGTTSSYTYAWYYSATSNGDWTTLSESASTTNVWNIASFSSSNVGYYHCVVTSKACTALVDTATIQLTLNTSCTPITKIDARSFNFGTAAATTLPTASNATITSTLSSATLSTWGSQWHIVTDASSDHSAFTGWGYGATSSTDQAFLGFRNSNGGIGTSSAFLTYTSTALPTTSGSYKVRFYHAPLANSACSGDKDNSLQVNVSVGGSVVETDTIAVGGTSSSTNSWTEWSYTFDTEGWGTAKDLVVTLTNQTAAGACRLFGLDDFEVLQCDNNYQYRLKLYDSNTQTSAYSSAVSTNTTHTLTLPCSGYFTYTAQKKVSSGSWTDITGKVDVNIPYQSKQVYFDVTGIGTTASATDHSADINIAMTALADSTGSFDWKTVFYTSAGVVTDSIKSADGSKVKTFATGATYRTFKKYKTATAFGSFVLADFWCEQSSGSVPAAYTGSNVSDEQEVSVSYTDAASAPTFTLQEVSHNLWVNNALYGTSQTSSNTMARATCSGTQGDKSTGSYYLFKQAAKPSTGGSTVLTGTVYEDATSKAATLAWTMYDNHTNAHVRYVYNTTTNTATVEPMANLSATYDLDTPVTGATAYLLVNGSETENASYKMVYGDPNNVEGKGNGVFVLDSVDMASVTSYKIATLNTYGGYNTSIWNSTFVTPTLTSGYAKFTYDFKTNCLTVDYYNSVDISLNCDNAITVGSNGGVTFKVTNSGSYAINASAYSLVVKVNGTTRTVTPTSGTGYPAIAIGGTQTFTLTGDSLNVANSNTITVTVTMTGDMNTNNNYCSKCGKPTGETIYYTIDNSLTADDDCSLSYRSLETAVTKLKATTEFFNSTTTELKKNIVMNVVNTGTSYVGTEAAGRTGGDVATALTIKLQNINNLDSASYQYKLNGKPRSLTIQAAVANNRPTLQHLIIRNSKNITLDGLVVTGSPDTTVLDNAIDIDDDIDWISGTTGRYVAANIRVQNCYIKSTGFTCIHASGYDGLTFVNNDIEAKLTTLLLANSNTQNWGASAKFIRCKNVNFERSNFRGDHATLTWLQESQNVLFMNNVFWSTNNTTAQIAFVRLLSQTGLSVDHNAFYYNTMFLNAGTNTQSYVDFFRLGSAGISAQSGNQTMYDATTIAFAYNNIYSYSTSVTGRRSDAFLSRTEGDFTNITMNNFWSQYDLNQSNSSSAFAVGTNVRFVNVKNEVCGTVANDPASLVIKGENLNLGVKIANDLSTLGADTLYTDRLHATTIRPTGGTGWTLGAYQQTLAVPSDSIIWTGEYDTNWDNRNNWIDAKTGQQLTCVHALADSLVVVIPAPSSSKYYNSTSKITNYPDVPTDFASTEIRPIKSYSEQVDAGIGTKDAGNNPIVPSKFAKKIRIEYGGSLIGVEKLVNATTKYYGEAEYEFTAGRSEWILVGSVVKPFTDATKTTTREVKSGDFFLNYVPQVYMHQVDVSTINSTISWENTFASLEQTVPVTSCFAIRIPDQYGPLKLPASYYYTRKVPNSSKVGDGTVSKTYNFNGRFQNDSIMPSYTGLTAGTSVFLNNSYPANVDPDQISTGSVQIYDYTGQSFAVPDPGQYIKPMHGFIFTPATDVSSLNITSNMVVTGDTRYKKLKTTVPYFQVELKNATDEYYSKIIVKYNSSKADSYKVGDDALKTFNGSNLDVPELYMSIYNQELSGVSVPKQDTIIPLGCRLNKIKDIEFSMYANSGYGTALLEDRLMSKTYDLTTGASYTIKDVPAGDIEGRFYLNLGGSDNPTSVIDGKDDVADPNQISIYTNGTNVIVSSSEGVVLEKVYISDMTGRTQVYDNLKAHYNSINLNVARGTYIINVVGDKATKQEKVIIK